MNEKVKAKIEAINASMAGPYPCDNGVSYAAPQCGACMKSRSVAVYCSHVKPLEEALAKTDADNAVLVGALEYARWALDVLHEKKPGGVHFQKYEDVVATANMKASAALARVKEHNHDRN